jgi:hypothetical protein
MYSGTKMKIAANFLLKESKWENRGRTYLKNWRKNPANLEIHTERNLFQNEGEIEDMK